MRFQSFAALRPEEPVSAVTKGTLYRHFPAAASHLKGLIDGTSIGKAHHDSVSQGVKLDTIGTIRALADQVQTSVQARSLLRFVNEWDPRQKKDFDDVRDRCRSVIFQQGVKTPYVETFVGSPRRFAISNEFGEITFAGLTQLPSLKNGINYDCMAIAKCPDGSELTAVADGMGKESYGYVASEIFANVVVSKMAEGEEFREAIKIASSVLGERSQDILILKTITILVGHLNRNRRRDNDWTLNQARQDIAGSLRHETALTEDQINQHLDIVIAYLRAVSPIGQINLLKALKNIDQLIQDLKAQPKFPPKNIFVKYKEPGSTIVVTKKWQVNGKTFIKYYYVGDSGIALYQQNIQEDHARFVLRGKSKAHSLVQNIFDDAIFHILAYKDCLTHAELEEEAEFLMRTHPLSNLVTAALTYLSASDPSVVVSMFESDDIELEQDQVYVLMRFSDRLPGAADLSEYEEDLAQGRDAQEMLNMVLARIERKNELREQVKNGSLEILIERLRYIWEGAESQIDTKGANAKDPRFLLELVKRLLRDDPVAQRIKGLEFLMTQYLKPPYYYYDRPTNSYHWLPPYFAIDGGYPDDTTIVLEVIST